MNILFLTVSRIYNVSDRGIYTDLIRKFNNQGHNIFIISPFERRLKQNTKLTLSENIQVLNVKTLNIQKTNFIEKGLANLLLNHQYSNAIKKLIPNTKFDLILYSTPPITLNRLIRSLKKNSGAKTYLLLKDIFPQNAVDIGLIKENGLIHKIFRKKEKELYKLSDHIGCMSPANVKYVLDNNPQVNAQKIEVNPNSIELIEKKEADSKAKQRIRSQFNIPHESLTLIYGGNLGKPQGVDFLLNVIIKNKNKSDVFFVIIGSGTEYSRLRNWFDKNNPKNALLLPGMKKEKYEQILEACDVGLILLDKRFTIPNFPSRLLGYLEYKKPIIAATDSNTDIGTIAKENGFGYNVINEDIESINKYINSYAKDRYLVKQMGQKGYEFLVKNYSVENSYNIITSHL